MKRNMQKGLQISSWGVERWAACFNYDKCRLPCGLRKHFDNLKAAAAGENEEWTKLYPEFAKVAKEEGFDEIAAAFTK